MPYSEWCQGQAATVGNKNCLNWTEQKKGADDESAMPPFCSQEKTGQAEAERGPRGCYLSGHLLDVAALQIKQVRLRSGVSTQERQFQRDHGSAAAGDGP